MRQSRSSGGIIYSPSATSKPSSGSSPLFYDGTGMPEFSADTFQFPNNSANNDPPTGPDWASVFSGGAKLPWTYSEGSWTHDSEMGDRVIAAAARTTGRGFRHVFPWDDGGGGDPPNGVNTGGGNILMDFGVHLPELWFRYHMRWASGIAIGTNAGAGESQLETGAWSYTKDLDFNNWTGNAGINRNTVGFTSSSYGGFIYTSPSAHLKTMVPGQTWDWNESQGGPRGSGLWLDLQVHMKMNSGLGTLDGEFHFWANGTLKVSYNNLNWNGGNAACPNGWRYCQVSNNQRGPASNSPAGILTHVDYADIQISTTGFIS